MQTPPPSPAPIIGVDLGMTSVMAAYVPPGEEKPVVIKVSQKHASLPAVVAFRDGGQPMVGRAAFDMVTTQPALAISGVKRLIGRKANSNAVRELRDRVGYEIPEGEAEVVVQVQGKAMRAPEIAGILLDQVRRSAEAQLGVPVTEAVLAVPAYFTEVQKQAVREAATLAGLTPAKLLHEPTAIALAYGYSDISEPTRLLVVDMGGVRLDVSVLEVSGNVFDVVGSGGDPFLGGADFDDRIAAWILEQVEHEHGRRLAEEPLLLQKVRTAAELAKRELSGCEAVDLQIPLSLNKKGEEPDLAQLRLRKRTVEELTAELVDRVIDTVQRTLQNRQLSGEDLGAVLLASGATATPALKARLSELLGLSVQDHLPPQEVIAFGSALLADSLGREAPSGREVLEQPIGISLADGRFMRIIDKDSQIPITRRVMIPTARDKQQTLEVDLFQGEGDDILSVEYLGTIVYQGIAEAPAGEAKVVVDLHLDAERLLTVSSPEPGRDEERFELHALGHAAREGGEHEPELRVAKGRPA